MPPNESRRLHGHADWLFVCGAVMWGGALPGLAQAAEFAYGFGYVAEHSDNISRTLPPGETRERVHSYSVGGAFRENSASLQANATVQAEYRDYEYDVYSDGPLYFVDASAVWSILPQRLTWSIRDRYDYGVLDPAIPYSPTNRTAINVFETGPELRVAMSPRNTLIFGARYGDVYYSELETDHTRRSATARWQYGVNSTTFWGLNYELLDLDYADDLRNDDIERHDYFLRYSRSEGRTHFVADLGGMTIERDRASKVSGTLVRLSMARSLTSESRISLLVGGEYTDAGSVLLDTGADAGGGAGTTAVSETVTSDLFYAKRAEATYVREGSWVGLNVTVFARDLDYLVAPLDRVETGGELTITHNPQGVTSTSVFGRTLNADYLNGTDREDSESTYGVRMVYRATRQISLSAEGSYAKWTSTDPTIGYVERRVLISLAYRSSPLFTAPPRR